jgi:hypothetical protein
MKRFLYSIIALSVATTAFAQVKHKGQGGLSLEQAFLHPPESAKPWVFWYWQQGAVSKAGITADMEAMKQEGIGGAYLMPIKGPANPPYINPPVVQLTPEWWGMVKFAMQEAKRVGIKLAMHDCDGFALAGGPWITPELSMQKVVWTETNVQGGKTFNDTLAKPESYKGYYQDIEVLAYPSLQGTGISTKTIKPKVTCSLPNTDLQYLVDPANKKSFATSEPCWIQLEFAQSFTCRSLVIHTNASNFQSERLSIEISDDGKNFRHLTQLEPPRHGWQDGDADITNDIVPTTAKYFRFIYNKEGTEPGAEDIDFAKWKPSLKLSGIELSAEPKIHQYEGKNGEVWRISKRTTSEQVPNELCVPKDKIINLTSKMDAQGRLHWTVPAGNWTILRIGHTSTGHTNATGGGGQGLECDKLNPIAAKVQFDHWFGEAFKQAGPELAKEVLKIFHIDSWECGSQNWSPVFAAEFKKRRGYDLLPYIAVMAGVPVESANFSEKVLSDIRQTIAELLVDNFYGTMAKLAHEKGCSFSAESVAPTMISDGMLHQSMANIPMGEFWLRSPTHDKPDDMLDAISGGHIYGKNIIQAEAFTELRLMWDEDPAMLKAMADRNFALGINRYVFHVSMHNPWLDRKPGMTLDGIGHFFQRDQTWWKPGKEWINYIQRCQALLQQGHPVADIAIFTGEETPRRAILPDRLVNTLPGIFGNERVKEEAERLANKGVPLHTMPIGVTYAANTYDPAKWIDPLRGYAYDSFNKDALLRLATVKNGRVVLPGGASYAVLVVPGNRPMNPEADLMSPEVIKKLKELADEGATIIMGGQLIGAPGIANDETVKSLSDQLFAQHKGKVITAPYQKNTFDEIGIARDLFATDSTGNHAKDIAWTHRKGDDFDIYFVSNQANEQRLVNLSFRVSGRIPELWNPLTGEVKTAGNYQIKDGRTALSLQLHSSGSMFIVFKKAAAQTTGNSTKNWPSAKPVQVLKESWQVLFDPAYGGPKQPAQFNNFEDWSQNKDDAIKYYSGTAVYTQTFNWAGKSGQQSIWLDLDKVKNLAEVYVNGIYCGTAWTAPYRVNIAKALKPGVNQLKIAVTNTWANRIMGDHNLPEDKRVSWTNAPYRLEGKSLLPAGLLGPVTLVKLDY